MKSIIDFLIHGINHIVRILDVKPFDDFNISYLQLILGSVVIGFIFKLVFGGFKETEHYTNGTIGDLGKSVSKAIDNHKRKEQINEYEPKHAKK